MWGSLFVLYISVLLRYHSGMKTSYNLRMEEDLKERLEKEARKDGRSLNNLINKVLCDFVAKRIVEKHWKEKDKPQERTWFGNDVAYDFPNCENYKDGRCEVFNCACKDEVACNTKFKKRWEKDKVEIVIDKPHYPRNETYCKACPYLNTLDCRIYGKGIDGEVGCTLDSRK